MVRTYQGDLGVQAHLEALLQRKALVEVGLLLGKAAVGARDLLLAAVPAPLKDGQEAAAQCTLGGSSGAGKSTSSGKKGAGASSSSAAASGGAAVTSVMLDVEWLVQHAEQVSRMLPGGVHVLGVYLFSSDAGYHSCLPQLCSVLQALRELHAASARASRLPHLAPESLVLLHADAASRKVTARGTSAGAAQGGAVTASSLSVSELKWAACSGLLLQIQCRWAVDGVLPVAAAGGPASLHQVAEELLQQQRAAVSTAVAALPSGSMPEPSKALAELLPAADAPALPVQLFPLQGIADAASGGDAGAPQQQPQPAVEAEVVAGQAALRGGLVGVAVVHRRQPWSSAVQELQGDLCESLRVRLELLVEDALSWQEEQRQGGDDAAAAGGEGGEAQQHPLLQRGGAALARAHVEGLPRRVQLPALGGLVPLYDYLLPGDAAGDSAARALELLGGALPPSLTLEQLEEQVVPLEQEAWVPKKKPPSWLPNQAPSGGAAPPGAAKGVAIAVDAATAEKSCSNTMAGGAMVGAAVAVGVLSAAVGALSLQGWFGDGA